MKHQAPHIEGLTDERIFLPGQIRLRPEQVDLEQRMANRSFMVHGGRAVAVPTTREQAEVTFTCQVDGAMLRTLLGVIEAERRLPRNRDLPPIILQLPTHQLQITRYRPKTNTVDQTSDGTIRVKMTLLVDSYEMVSDKG